MNNRVVITGIGVVSPVGMSVPQMWESLISGVSGADYITHFDTENFNTKIAAEVKNFDATNYMSRKEARHMDRFAQFAAAASFMSVENAGLEINQYNARPLGKDKQIKPNINGIIKVVI